MIDDDDGVGRDMGFPSLLCRHGRNNEHDQSGLSSEAVLVLINIKVDT